MWTRAAAIAAIVLASQGAQAQDQPRQAFLPAGTILYPASSVRGPVPLAAGFPLQTTAYTNVIVFQPAAAAPEPPSATTAAIPDFFSETPASLACVYGLSARTPGCNPNVAREPATGGTGTIAIVDAFHTPNVREDLATFSNRFGLPAADLEVVSAGGTVPPVDSTGGWELETSLDVQWAHAMAPRAKLLLVEASSASYSDLMAAVDKATELLSQRGGGQVSLSWGSNEFASQSTLNARFRSDRNVSYFAATGDNSSVSYPATAANVVAVGGTRISRDASGDLIREEAWALAGAGQSSYERRPGYQDGVSPPVNDSRGVPDVSAVSDPQAGGVWVYVTSKGWSHVGGTSAATPIVAAIANAAARNRPNSAAVLDHLYRRVGTSDFNDVVAGTCGVGRALAARPGWDYCTGVGTPNGTGGF